MVAVSASAAAVEEQTEEKTVQRLLGIYQEKVVPAMQEEFKYGNKFEIPHVKKIIVNCGVGEASQNAKALEGTIRDIALVTGQKSVVTRSRKAIAGFKLREGVPVGVTLTLRGDMMYSFLDRLLNLALPRTRDFQGVNPYSFDGRGNYTLGLPEISVFPEIKFENIDKQRGMDICIVTTAKNDTEGLKLLELMGMPFKEMGGGRMSASAAKKATRQTFRGRRR
jgi:large subunit ribosomal protein L5